MAEQEHIKDSNPKGPNNLQENEATNRSKQVSHVKYQFTLTLTKGSEHYHGDVTISFDYTPVQHAKELFLEFIGKQIHSLVVNGEAKTGNVWSSNRLHIGSLLKPGGNVVRIVYVNEYDHSGDGFHQFTDPEDKQEYLYTNFEPFECHRLIPCFDQPDIKAQFSLNVEAPSEWKVIANSKLVKSEQKQSSSLHHFKDTPRMSTYLFAIVAGPYDNFEDNYDNRVPLGIYIRKSLTKYLDKENIFTQTKQGLAFYESFFDFQYPFDKYDQLFVPEFNVGAMENIGCVTFTESYIFKDPPTRSQHANRADTILHEMAHMWFGNLVTPVWWNGLWLNESFATYMAALCVSSATEFGNLSWQNFNSSMKQWAYREDQLSTTHPIEGNVVDTDATVLIFDGITYGKGASLLKQLVHVVGMDSFKAGMRYYFKKYAWGNTTIAQFLEALASVTDRLDSSAWAQEWLQTAGLNSLHLNIVSQNGKITAAYVEQTAPPAHPTLRRHTTELAVYEDVAGTLHINNTYRVVVEAQARTDIPELIGKDAPVFSFINHNDHAFAKCILDPVSLNFVLSQLERISDPFLRQLLWTLLYDLTRDAKMKSTSYLELVYSKIGIETDAKLVQTILTRASAALIHFVPNSLVQKYADSLFDALFGLLQTAKTEEFKLVWARYTVDFARSAKTVGILAEQLKNGNTAFAQDLRWGIVVRMVAWNLPGAQEALAAEQERDKSDTGTRAALRAGTSVPNIEVKNQAWARFLDTESKLSVHQSAAEMSGFYWFHQESLLEPFIEKFFSSLRSVFKSRDKEFAGSFFHYLFPTNPENPKIIQYSRTLLAQLDPEEKHLKKILNEEIDDLERESKCRNLVLS